MIWCPYLGEWIPKDVFTVEHIIPLALGGSNKLTIPASTHNSKYGGEIEGKLERDMILKLARVQTNTAGRSKGRKGKRREIEYVFRNVKAEDGRLLRMAFQPDGVELYDPVAGKAVDEPTKLSIETSFHRDEFVLTRLRLVAKVALSYGVFRYGDLYREHVDHAAIRELLEAESITDAKDALGVNVDVPIFGEEETTDEGVAIRGLCKAVYPLSCIGILWSEKKLHTFLGVLGQYVGCVGADANFAALDDRTDHVWGSFLVVRREKLSLMGLQQAMSRLREFFLSHPDLIDGRHPDGLCEFIEQGGT